jgi:hypothetical protein
LRQIVGFVCREMEAAGGVGSGADRERLRQLGDVDRDPAAPRRGPNGTKRRVRLARGARNRRLVAERQERKR